MLEKVGKCIRLTAYNLKAKLSVLQTLKMQSVGVDVSLIITKAIEKIEPYKLYLKSLTMIAPEFLIFL